MPTRTAYTRAYYRAKQRQDRTPSTRELILALLMRRGSMTTVQMLDELGPTYYHECLFYHLSRLVAAGQVAKEPRPRRTTGDRSLFTYRIIHDGESSSHTSES